VNTNFTRANPHDVTNDVGVANLLKRGMIGDDEHEQFFRRFIGYQARLMPGLQNLLKELKGSDAIDRIVVRPHPVENRDTWRRWAKPLDIDVHGEGNAIEWMLAAEAVLHPGCTTAIEGLLLDRPVFSYVPEPDGEFINPSDAISEWVTGADDFQKRLLEIRRGGEQNLRERLAPQREKLRHFVANVDPPYAADRILDELEQLDMPGSSAGRNRRPKSSLFSQLRRQIRRWRNRDPGRVARRWQKFPGLTEHEAELVVGDWLRAGVLQKPPNIDRLGERLLMFQ
jgi:hypothetical protein